MRVGITGIMGSGKSTALDFFKKNGFNTLDSDALVQNLLQSNLQIIESLRDHFEEKIFQSGTIDNKALADIVFGDESELKWLESLLHPRVIQEIEDSMKKQTSKDWAIEVPLLFEKDLEYLFDYTICISVNPKIQSSRLSERGVDIATAKKRTRRQLSNEQKCQRATFTFENNGSAEDLKNELKPLLKKLG